MGCFTCSSAPNSRSTRRSGIVDTLIKSISAEMESEQDLREFQREYLEFLDEDVSNLSNVPVIVYKQLVIVILGLLLVSPIVCARVQEEHRERVKEMIRANKHRLVVNVNYLRKHSPRRSTK